MAVLVGVCCAVLLAGPTAALADWYDAFNDNESGGAPGAFDIDNPNWAEHVVAATSSLLGVDEGRVRFTVENTFLPFCFSGMAVDQEDPNECVFENTAAHYVIANMRTHDDNWDPGNGMLGVWTHADMIVAWTAYVVEYEANNGWMSLTSYSGFTWLGLEAIGREDDGYPQCLWDPNSPFDPDLDPNVWNPGSPLYDPNYADPNLGGWENYNEYEEDTIWPKDPMIPQWMVIQFDPNGVNHDANNPDDPNDPNCHWVRGAAWVGAKHDWDGTWTLQANCVGNMLGKDVSDEIFGDFPFDPNIHMDAYLHENGHNAVGGFSGGNAKQPNTPAYVVDASYDDFESRWGYYTNVSHTLTLSVVKPQFGVVAIDPDILDDPNDAGWFDPNFFPGYDPNFPLDPDYLRRYTNGTAIVLTAQPISGKSLKQWTIFDPNHPGDANYAVTDTNTVLYLTMDADWEVEAKFKCGASVPPFVAMTLLALGLAVVVRRLF